MERTNQKVTNHGVALSMATVFVAVRQFVTALNPLADRPRKERSYSRPAAYTGIHKSQAKRRLRARRAGRD